MRFNIASLYVIVYLMVELPKISTLFPWKDMKDQSICLEIITKMQFRNVPYYETYWHRVLGIYKQERHRINYKIEYYPTFHTQKKCCNGYKEVSNKCVPNCFPDCENGLCKAPDTCECFPGYSISTEEKHICKPICSNGCWNGECIQPEVCICYPDYFIDSDGYICRPNCEEKCDPNNGYCVEPNTCGCNFGYKKSNESEMCDPICERECINGRCVEPNTCSCYDDYELDVNDSFNCIPKCEQNCLFGTCTAPNVCTCNIGYKPINESDCKPICNQPCVMGVCIAPDICNCIVGYKFSNISVHVCEPHCEHECINGTCIAPNICKCNEGFTFDEDDETRTVCKPFCTFPCDPNAECTAPDRCTCHEGYRFFGENDTTNNISTVSNNENGTICVPVCKKDCENGKCVFPDVCICEEGYDKVWVQMIPDNINSYPCTSICKKVCDLNGNCNAPDNCICNNTYHNTKIQGKYICQPSCNINCEHGTCEAPNVCTCDEGYKQNEKGRCVDAICHPSCINGTCTKPNVCTCYDGYRLRNETICEPICESSCLNGTCVAPNTCRCNEGYFEIKNDNVSTCASTCSRNCSEHGTCLDEQNSCSCFFGWTGVNCDEASLCVYETTLDSILLSSITIMNETNSTLTKSYDNAPLCYQCFDSVDNATLCFVVHSNESLTIPTVGCFLSTELPCYRRPHNNALKSSSNIMELLIVITIAITIVATINGYIIARKCRKQSTILIPNEQINSLTSDSDTLIMRDEDYLIEQ
uniref:multiple epidermal growth factor-like domains protein 11 isoform X1 n=2 Tax=Vespula vulgaris TaxID=7454 RepID=UPI002124B212|nr:multiple epidermal growth factor-like domains protein 11 isoform X1 [Vespula vulgaris]